MKRARPEAEIQRAVFEQLRLYGAPRLFAFHPANGGFRKPIEGAVLQGLGLRAGLPDVIAIHEGRCYGLELKAPRGRLHPRQVATLDEMADAGALTCVADGLDVALGWLEAMRLLRGSSATRPGRERPPPDDESRSPGAAETATGAVSSKSAHPESTEQTATPQVFPCASCGGSG
jgi:hypothetical protein